jgi:PAS domain S-box-containing protein
MSVIDQMHFTPGISAAEFQSVFAAAPIALALADEKGRCLEVNAAACRLLGRPAGELIGMNILSITHPDNLESDLEGIQRLVSAEIDRFDTESRWFHHSGRVLWVKVSVSCIRQKQIGTPLYIAGFEDITARKQAESEMNRLQEQIRRSETIMAMGTLVGGVAHEVRNPLFAITATLDAMESRLGQRPEYATYIKVLRAEAARMTDLMQRLLVYGKPAAADQKPEDLREVLKAAQNVERFAASAKEVSFYVNGEPEQPLMVSMDFPRLVSAFQNVLDNAVQFSSRGGKVFIDYTVTDTDVVCTVRDEGPGFEIDEENRAFQPFYSRRPGGTGLGLSLVQKIVHEHQGEVRAENHPDGGAMISVSLPIYARSV